MSVTIWCNTIYLWLWFKLFFWLKRNQYILLGYWLGFFLFFPVVKITSHFSYVIVIRFSLFLSTSSYQIKYSGVQNSKSWNFCAFQTLLLCCLLKLVYFLWFIKFLSVFVGSSTLFQKWINFLKNLESFKTNYGLTSMSDSGFCVRDSVCWKSPGRCWEII